MSDLQRGNYAATQCGVAEHQWTHWSQVFLTLVGAALRRADGLLEGMVDAGFGVDAISQFLGCAPTQIVSELETRKIIIDDAQRDKTLRKRKGGWSPNDHILLAAGWMSGVSITTIAEHVGRKPAAVYGKKRRMGLPTRPRIKTIEHPKSEQTSQLDGNAPTSPSNDFPESGESSSYCAGSPSNDDARAAETAAASMECVSVEAFAAGAPIIIRDAIETNTPKQSETTPIFVFAQGGIRSTRETPNPADIAGWCELFKVKHLKNMDLSGMLKADAMVETAIRAFGGESPREIAKAMKVALHCIQSRLFQMHLRGLPCFSEFDGNRVETMLQLFRPKGCTLSHRFYFQHRDNPQEMWKGLKQNKKRQRKKKAREKPADTFETSIRSHRKEGSKVSLAYYKCLYEPRISL